MASINPYLNFDGKTEEAFNFYKSVFGGEFAMFQKMKDAPGSEQQKVSADEMHRVMHVALPIGKNNILMGSDTFASSGAKHVEGNNIQISISADSREEAETIFQKLSAGGNVMMPLEKAFWGSYFGMVTDRFGIQWMMSFDEKSR